MLRCQKRHDTPKIYRNGLSTFGLTHIRLKTPLIIESNSLWMRKGEMVSSLHRKNLNSKNSNSSGEKKNKNKKKTKSGCFSNMLVPRREQMAERSKMQFSDVWFCDFSAVDSGTSANPQAKVGSAPQPLWSKR